MQTGLGWIWAFCYFLNYIVGIYVFDIVKSSVQEGAQ
jgi:hypothetical protein